MGGFSFLIPPDLYFVFIYLFIFKDFIYSFMRDTETLRDRQGEKQASRRKPDVGLDSKTLRSHLSQRQIFNH